MPPTPRNLTQLEFRNLLNLCEAAVRLEGAGQSSAVLMSRQDLTEEIRYCCERHSVPEATLWKWYRAMGRQRNLVVQDTYPFWKDALAELLSKD